MPEEQDEEEGNHPSHNGNPPGGEKIPYRITLTRRDKTQRWYLDYFSSRDAVMNHCWEVLDHNPNIEDAAFENMTTIPYDEPLD